MHADEPCTVRIADLGRYRFVAVRRLARGLEATVEQRGQSVEHACVARPARQAERRRIGRERLDRCVERAAIDAVERAEAQPQTRVHDDSAIEALRERKRFELDRLDLVRRQVVDERGGRHVEDVHAIAIIELRSERDCLPRARHGLLWIRCWLLGGGQARQQLGPQRRRAGVRLDHSQCLAKQGDQLCAGEPKAQLEAAHQRDTREQARLTLRERPIGGGFPDQHPNHRRRFVT